MRFLRLVPCLLVACSSAELPADFGGSPLWEPVRFDDARDLGHVPEPVEGAAAGPITLVDVTAAAGLSGALAGGNQHGVGVAFVDLTGDGYADIFVANGTSNAGGAHTSSSFWVNRGDGTFEDATARAGFDAVAGLDCFSVAAADYDNDGDVDLYLGAQPRDVLLENDGGGRFADVTARAGAGGPVSPPNLFRDGRSKVVAFGDYDGDGWLDIVSASSALPDPFVYLLKNRGDGTFEDVTRATEVMANPFGNPCAVLFSDYDNDVDPDLWIWNDRGGHILLRNEGGERFSDVTEASLLSRVDITHPMGIDAADIDHDGDLDYYISNIGNNPLLRNNGDGTFSDITGEAGTGGSYGWGLAFEDFDADGYADLFVAQEDDRPHLVFRNRAESPPRFDEIEVPHAPIRNGSAAHNVAAGFADYDHDGRVDVVVAGTDGRPITLYRNQTELGAHRWLHVLIPRPPGATNAGAVGARVAIGVGDIIQFADVHGGSSRASQNEHGARFGLGPVSGADWAAVLWPSGAQYVVTGVEGSRRLIVESP